MAPVWCEFLRCMRDVVGCVRVLFLDVCGLCVDRFLGCVWIVCGLCVGGLFTVKKYMILKKHENKVKFVSSSSLFRDYGDVCGMCVGCMWVVFWVVCGMCVGGRPPPPPPQAVKLGQLGPLRQPKSPSPSTCAVCVKAGRLLFAAQA